MKPVKEMDAAELAAFVCSHLNERGIRVGVTAIKE